MGVCTSNFLVILQSIFFAYGYITDYRMIIKEDIMKNRFLKRVLAATLTVALTATSFAATDITDASAAAKDVKLSAASKTLKVGQTYKLKLKNNSLGWKVKKAVSKNKKVCQATGKKHMSH